MTYTILLRNTSAEQIFLRKFISIEIVVASTYLHSGTIRRWAAGRVFGKVTLAIDTLSGLMRTTALPRFDQLRRSRTRDK